jgi:RimJ/RimL family protein N-acetyltransferase
MPELIFRRVEYKDVWAIYAWRREPDTEYWSLDTPPDSVVHRQWMDKAVKDDNIYIAERKGQPAAVCSVNDNKEVSVTVNPYLRRQGIGRECIQFLQGRYSKLTAIIVLGNAASLRLFVGCGFDIKDADYIQHRPCVILEWRAPCAS